MDLVFGELAAAGAHFDEALSLAASVRYPFGVIAALQSLAQLTIADGRPDAADRLFKSTAKLRQIVGDDANDVEMPRSTSATAGRVWTSTDWTLVEQVISEALNSVLLRAHPRNS